MAQFPATPRLCPVMVGRDAELAAVHAFVRGGRGVLLISGEAGIGKSRLVREARECADMAGICWLEGHLYREDRAMPMALALDMLRQVQQRTSPEAFRAAAGAGAVDLARLLPGLGETRDPPSDDPELARRRLCEACANVLLRCSGEPPLLLACEDLHWADSGSVTLALQLARYAQRGQFLLLLTYRSDEVTPDLAAFLAQVDHERLADEIHLRPLQAAEVAAVMREMFRTQTPAPANFLHTICSLTDGNPFFIEEVLSTIAADQAVVTTSGSWVAGTTASTLVPRSVRETVARRMSSLSPTAREVAQLAAVCGRQFEFEFIQYLCGLSESALLAVLKELIAAHLVAESTGDRFTFRHALTREALLEGLLEREMRARHRRIFESLSTWPGTSPEHHLDALARHAYDAGMWAEAATAALLAADHAASLLAPRPVTEQLTRAIAALRAQGEEPPGEWLSRRGRAYEMLGDFPAALADHEAALAQALAGADQRGAWQALLDLSLLWATRDYGKAGAYATQALDAAEKLGDALCTARALNRLGNWQLNRDDPHAAIAYHTRALDVFRSVQEERGVAETLDLLGISSLLGGQFVAGRAWYEQSIAHYRHLQDRRGLAGALMGITLAGPTYHGLTVPESLSRAEVEAAATEALALCRDMEWRAGEAYLRWGVDGMCLGACGAYATALAGVRTAIDLAQQIGHRQWETSGRCILGLILSDLGDDASARAELAQALALAQTLHSPYWIRSASGWLASVLVRQGDYGAARALLQHIDVTALPMDTIAARVVWTTQVELELADNHPAAGLEILRQLYIVNTDAVRGPVTLLELLHGQALAALGDLPRAQQALQEAADMARQASLHPLALRIAVALADVARRQRDTATADTARTLAHTLRAELAVTIPDARLRDCFLAKYDPSIMTLEPEPPAAPTDSLQPLTRRETEVALLLVKGLSNRAIGELLFLSEWTVATHVRNILAKLGLTNRAQIAAWVTQRHRLN